MRLSLSMKCVMAAAVLGGAAQMAAANDWAAYRSGLVDVINDPSAGWTFPNYKYETFGVSAGGMSSGVLSQTVTTNYNARATYYSFGSSSYSLGASGLTSLSADVSVSGDTLLRLVQSTVDPNTVEGTGDGVSMAWYMMYQDGSGNFNIWLSNAANRLSLNDMLNDGPITFSVGLNASNFQAFPAWPQGGADFATSVANAQYFGLLVTTATASGSDFSGHNLTEWIDVDGGAWNPYATQRNGNYGAYSAGNTTISISNAVPAPGALALLGAAGLVRSRRRR